MKNTLYLFIVIALLFLSFNVKKTTQLNQNSVSNLQSKSFRILKDTTRVPNDTIKIVNKELEYEVIIIDTGFSFWLSSRSFPRGYHSLSFLETKNIFYVTEWNNRVLQPQRFNSNLYEMTIDYQPNIRYGYEVNYLIYNYMIFFQNTYNQKLFGIVPNR